MYNLLQGYLSKLPGSMIKEEVAGEDGTTRKVKRCIYGVWSRVVFGELLGGGLLPDAVHENGPLDDLNQQRRPVQRSPTS